MESFSLIEQIVLFTVIMLTESVLFKNILATSIHSLLDERSSDSSTEEYSKLVLLLQLSEILRKILIDNCLY